MGSPDIVGSVGAQGELFRDFDIQRHVAAVIAFGFGDVEPNRLDFVVKAPAEKFGTGAYQIFCCWGIRR